MKLHTRWLILGIIAFGALLLLRARNGGFDYAKHNPFHPTLVELQRRDAALNQDVLKAHLRLLSDYDSFAGELHDMRQAAERLATMPAFVPGDSQPAFRAKLAEFLHLLDRKEQLLESFKSANAVLNNSLRYLPIAKTALLGHSADDVGNRELDADVNSLMQEVPAYCLSPDREQMPAIDRALATLAEWREKNPAHPQAVAVGGFAAHVRCVVARKPVVEVLTREIVAILTGPCAEELLALYDVQLADALRREDRSRSFLHFGCAFLLLGIGYAFYELSAAKRDLERRVAERTRDLQSEITERTRTELEVVKSQRFLQSTLDALSAHIAILDDSGVIISVNAAWNRFANSNSQAAARLGTGVNYITVSEESSGECAGEAPAVARGIRAVLAGEAAEFQLEYPRHSPNEKGWFVVRVTCFDDDGRVRVVVAHENITERKLAECEMEKMHTQLIDSSRQAGMAEVATNVLHNVGNVLNSVNVSATLVVDGVKKSKVGDLARVVAVLNQHAADLGAFVMSNPQGKNLPAFLRQLSEHLARERQDALSELESLRENIDHIKDIVAMQQSYAKVSGVTEVVKITDLVEDSLRMNAGALTRHEVEIVRDYQVVPPISVEKHKVLQILVNLIRNAKYACDEADVPDKRMTLRVINGGGSVKICVSDNGVGVPPENLTRIFNHGFSTRKEGHGFGLHSGALAAQEMGGSLRVHSEGLGRGAAFTLELPCQPVAETPAIPKIS